MIEWWVLVDPENDGWQRVSEEEAKHYPVVEGRLTHAISYSAIGALLEEEERRR